MGRAAAGEEEFHYSERMAKGAPGRVLAMAAVAPPRHSTEASRALRCRNALTKVRLGVCSRKAPPASAGKEFTDASRCECTYTHPRPPPHLRHRLRYECGQAVGGVGGQLRGGLQPLVQRLHAQLPDAGLQLLLLAPAAAPNGR